MSRPAHNAALAVLALASGALADMVTLAPSKDNTLFQDPAGALSDGAGLGFFVGQNNQSTNNLRRGVLAFDIAGAVPAGATITGASLTLHMSSSQSIAAAIEMHRLLADWGEGASTSGNNGSGAPSAPGDATWLHTFYPGSFWAMPGGDFSPTVSAMQTVTGIAFYTWSGPGLVADIQSFLDAPGGDFGWLLMGGESTPQSVKRFDSREITTVSFRPSLQVTYTTVPAPPSVCSAALLGLLAARRRRR